ncbi:peptide/nickel transport system substrate-binding protein [Paenarthrobacter nicotinovorans]|uniref:ABC transporter substrate-binding protein n=1 Tax=Paenarthrobacter nicotinovorans TaxID=29320 RepID=UPI00278A8FA9|nr:ABC transporter substrate-binding protein [Paenarthrobacter nicotinovorans]MDP9933736.1 peptide/nickel transport system substrate-binding protein [Paenarthrobacter nicotinovorans]
MLERNRHRRRLAAAGAITAAAIVLTSCSTAGAPQNPTVSKDTLSIAVPSALTGFSPQVIGDGYALQWMQAAYDSLLFAENDGSYSGHLAKSYEYNTAETVLTLHLVSGVTFQDGSPLNAKAVEVNLEATRDGSGGSASALASVKDVVAVNDDTVEVNLSAADPTLVRSLSQVPGMIANPKSIGSASLNTTPDGTGPYTLNQAESVSGSSYVFTKKADYWDKDLSLPFSTIKLQSITDSSAALSALQSGQLDASFVPTGVVDQAKASGLTISPYSAPGLVGLYLWDRDGALVPALGDVRVRQAINYAIDKDALLKGVRAGYGKTTGQLFRPDWPASDPGLDAAYKFDPDKARTLLSDAGYGTGLTLEMHRSAGIPESDLVAQYLADVGITVKWIPSTNIGPDIQSGKSGMSLFQLASQAPWQIVTFFLLPNSPWNVFKSETPELDTLITSARSATTAEDRDAVLKKINTYLVDQAWFAPFYTLTGNYASTNGVVVNAPYVNVPAIFDFQLAK